jgi:hypothetical protein
VTRAVLLAAPVVTLALLSQPRVGSASCGPPATSIGTPSGARIPVRGVMFTRGLATLEIRSLGAASTRTVVQSPNQTGHGAIERHDYVAWAGPMRLSTGGPAFEYDVDLDWVAEAAAPRVVSLARVELDGCPGLHGISMSLDQPVAAVRVRWRAPVSLGDLLLVPRARPAEFGGGASLFLGDDACDGESFPIRLLREGISVELIQVGLRRVRPPFIAAVAVVAPATRRGACGRRRPTLALAAAHAHPELVTSAASSASTSRAPRSVGTLPLGLSARYGGAWWPPVLKSTSCQSISASSPSSIAAIRTRRACCDIGL